MAAEQETAVWLAADEDRLYIAVQAKEAVMATLRAEVRKRDGAVWGDDSIDFYLLLPGKTNAYHFIANLLGTRYDARMSLGTGAIDASWNADWQAAAQRQDDGWTMEIALPFAALGFDAQLGAEPLSIQLCRMQRRLSEFAYWPAWGARGPEEFSQIQGLKLDPKRYGLVLDHVVIGQRRPGANEFRATLGVDPQGDSPLKLRAIVEDTTRHATKTFTAECVSHPGQTVCLPFNLPDQGGPVSLVIEIADAHGRPRVSFSDGFNVPATISGALSSPIVYPSDRILRFRGRAVIPEAKLSATHVQAILRRGTQQVAAPAVAFDRATGTIKIGIPVAKLAEGAYLLEVRATSGPDAHIEGTSSFEFRIVPGPLD